MLNSWFLLGLVGNNPGRLLPEALVKLALSSTPPLGLRGRVLDDMTSVPSRLYCSMYIHETAPPARKNTH
jgi:hypothetical protein